MTSTKPWQEIAKLAQDHRDKSIALLEPSIPEVPEDLPLNVSSLPRQILSEVEVQITETAPEDLVSQLASGKLTATKCIKAFLRRAGLAQKLTNCVTELLPKYAIDRAQDLDEYLKAKGKPIGPLHGLPLSVKEHCAMATLIQNCGFVSWYDRIAPADAHIITLLLNAGAIPFARTTQPQCLMHLETSNNFYGTTTNPYNTALTSGGSSGGEGSLIALKGSCLGIGTDIGGSIRNPAGNCGVFGFKPTTKRMPMEGFMAPMLGQEQIVPTCGPLGASLTGCEMFVKVILDQRPWEREPDIVPLGWRRGNGESYLDTDASGQKKLKIGVLWHDGVVRPHPPVTRTLKSVVEKLQAVPGVEVVEWTPYKHDLAWEIISSLYFCDGAAQDRAAIEASGEPWRPLSRFIIHEQAGVPNEREGGYTIAEVWDLTIKRDMYRAEYAKLWKERGPDVILCPVSPGAAPPLDHARYWGYTSQWNLLDYPALVFPASKVGDEDGQGKEEEEFEAITERDAWNWKLWTDRGVEGYKDAPVSLQVVGRRYEDEKVFEAVELILEKAGLPMVA